MQGLDLNTTCSCKFRKPLLKKLLKGHGFVNMNAGDYFLYGRIVVQAHRCSGWLSWTLAVLTRFLSVQKPQRLFTRNLLVAVVMLAWRRYDLHKYTMRLASILSWSPYVYLPSLNTHEHMQHYIHSILTPFCLFTSSPNNMNAIM